VPAEQHASELEYPARPDDCVHDQVGRIPLDLEEMALGISQPDDNTVLELAGRT
jgi:hypothetical protein